MKRILIWLCTALLLAASVFSVYALEPAQTEQPEQTEATEEPKPLVIDKSIVSEAEAIYRQCCIAAGRESFHGYCGMMTSYQLWKLGINTYLDSHDGNKQFDTYKDRKVTTGGYDIEAYSAENYDLLQTLQVISRNGTRNVRNILVGFQWTNTEAGARFGHACIINAIQDGVVYFTESFDSHWCKEGKTITCTMEEFAEYFNQWTVYEGAIYFGTKKYANSCPSYGTDLYVQLRFASVLRSQPCLLGRNESLILRDLSAGELLHAVGVYTNEEGDLFYRIDDGGVTGYVSANAVYTVQINENITLQNIKIPQYIDHRRDLHFSGTVKSEGVQLEQIHLRVTNHDGEEVLQTQMPVKGQSAEIRDMDELITFHLLPKGQYWVHFVAEVSYYMAEDGELTAHREEKLLCKQPLGIGTDPQAYTPEEKKEETFTDGWFVRDGVWYCKERGFPVVGWTTRIGVHYYLKEDGSVTTGWLQEEDGKLRYFSVTGALCSGWTTTPSGTYYLLSEGAVATGMVQIDGKQYWFDENGILGVGGTCTWEEVTYQVHPDGTVTPIEVPIEKAASHRD